MSEDKFKKLRGDDDQSSSQQKASSRPMSAKPPTGKKEESAPLPKQPAPKKPVVEEGKSSANAGGASVAGAIGGLAASILEKANETAAQAASAIPQEVIEEVTTKVSEVKDQYSDLLNRVKMTDAAQEISDISAKLAQLPNEIEHVRSRGYVFRAYLENKASVLVQQWADIKDNVQATIQRESSELSQHMSQVENAIKSIDSLASNILGQQRVLPMLESALDTLDDRVSAAENLVQSLWEPIQTELSTTQSQLSEIKRYLDLKDEASFPFLAAESVYLVAEAEWQANDNPDGLIYLTDQRLIFEQREKKGKTLGLFGGKEVQEVLWEVPVNLVEEIKPESQGVFGGKDLLHFTFRAGAPYASVTVEIMGGDAKDWAKRFKQVFTGEAQGDRAIQPDPELIERLRNAPTACPVCGGMLQQIVAGQTEAKCPYCGAVIRL